MRAAFPPPRRGPAERLAAWVVTGPLGHLWSVVADLAVYTLRSGAGRVRRRLPAQRKVAGAGRRSSERR